jgi:hypothetical protein
MALQVISLIYNSIREISESGLAWIYLFGAYAKTPHLVILNRHRQLHNQGLTAAKPRYAAQVACTVLRMERGIAAPDLPDYLFSANLLDKFSKI